MATHMNNRVDRTPNSHMLLWTIVALAVLGVLAYAGYAAYRNSAYIANQRQIEGTATQQMNTAPGVTPNANQTNTPPGQF